MRLVACLRTDFDMEIQHSQLKINHPSDTSSTKAVGGGISVVCLTRTSRYRSKRRSWLVPLLPTMPEKNVHKYMTAPARYYSETQIIDGRIGEPFASDEDVDQVDQHAMQISTCQFMRVNRFMLMFRLAQYWLLDFFHVYVIED